LRGVLREDRVALLREQGLPPEGEPAPGRCSLDPSDPRRHRARALRYRLPDGLRVGAAPGVARGQADRRSRRGPLDLGARHPGRADRRNRPHGPALRTWAPPVGMLGLRDRPTARSYTEIARSERDRRARLRGAGALRPTSTARSDCALLLTARSDRAILSRFRHGTRTAA